MSIFVGIWCIVLFVVYSFNVFLGLYTLELIKFPVGDARAYIKYGLWLAGITAVTLLYVGVQFLGLWHGQ